MNAAIRELSQMGNINLNHHQTYGNFIIGYKQYKQKKSRILSKMKRARVKRVSRATDQLKNDDVYTILYLHKVEKFTPAELAEQFKASEIAIKAVVEGKARTRCYENFMIVESLLNR
ncbi:MAG TPA: hypothetical protein VK947_13125 [Planococcus sp. (in: firmicutes)]|nr:hypothetical protein [Planococcus sp. (in: firmicutes)]